MELLEESLLFSVGMFDALPKRHWCQETLVQSETSYLPGCLGREPPIVNHARSKQWEATSCINSKNMKDNLAQE